MAKKSIKERYILKGHTEVHPALDFYNDKAIVSVARPGVTVYDDDSSTIEQFSICITSDGEEFILNSKELLDRKLFYLKELDLSLSLWEVEDQEQFAKQLRNGHKPEVDLLEIHSNLKSIYMDLFDFSDKKLYDFFPAFIIYTYFFPLFESAPVLHLWGPAGSGKTKIMETMAMTCFNPVTSGNITEAGVFRLVEGRRGVCLLDESEDLSKTERGHAITNLILNGYRRGNLVYRMDRMGRNITSSHYNVFSPKVIANITGLDKEALLSRAIRIVTSNTRDASKANRYTAEVKDKTEKIRNQLYHACLTMYNDVIQAKAKLPDVGLSGRSAEIWQGILAIAWIVNGETWHNIAWLAIESADAINRELIVADPTWDLLSALLNIVTLNEPRFYPNNAVWNCVNQHACGEFTSKQQVTALLKRQDIPPRLKWEKGKTARGFVLSKELLEEKLSYLTTYTTLRPYSKTPLGSKTPFYGAGN